MSKFTIDRCDTPCNISLYHIIALKQVYSQELSKYVLVFLNILVEFKARYGIWI